MLSDSQKDAYEAGAAGWKHLCENQKKRIAELDTALRRICYRLRYLAGSADRRELNSELHALARESENAANNLDGVPDEPDPFLE